MKIISRKAFDDFGGMDEIELSCGHFLMARAVPNERLIKAGMQDTSYVSPDSTVTLCPLCENEAHEARTTSGLRGEHQE